MKILAILGCVLLFAASYAAATFFTRGSSRGLGPAVDEIDYVSQLPNPADLVNDSEAPARIAKIVQTEREVTVTYAAAGGKPHVVSYRLLSNVGSAGEPGSAWAAVAASPPAPAAASPAPAPAAAPVPAPVPAAAPVYYDNSPSNTVVNELPAPAEADAAPAEAVYQQPAPAYYGAGPGYPAADQAPLPAYYYYTPAFAYYYSRPSYGRPVPREFPRSEPRMGFPGGSREGVRSGGRR